MITNKLEQLLNTTVTYCSKSNKYFLKDIVFRLGWATVAISYALKVFEARHKTYGKEKTKFVVKL